MRPRPILRYLVLALTAAACSVRAPLHAQQALTWEQVKARFEANNPALKADADNVEEFRAEEITAYLRPNPTATFLADQLYPFYKNPTAYRPFGDSLIEGTIGYLHERAHKRELRLQSAREGTHIAQSLHEDLDRTLLFTVRAAFVQTLEARTILDLAKADLDYYDKIIDLSRKRLQTGDIAQVDFKRIELLRVQYESEIETATVDLRTAKIQLLQLLNDTTPVDEFDVTGTFGFDENLASLDQFRQDALVARPDLQAATQTIEQSRTNHKLAIANGSTDPTFTVDSGRNTDPLTDPFVGFSVSVPIRIFDRNQGEKARTLIDIDRSQQTARETRALVFSDVNSAYEQLRSSIALLKPYRDKYREEATQVRDIVTHSYMLGGASLIDFLNAQSDYRAVQLAYAQLIGSYLTAAAQLNLAVGREVIP